ncbi:MAG: DUF5777 family beta-barrel protein [Marinifilaceae bacterium]
MKQTLLILTILISSNLYSQNQSFFKSTRIINTHSVNTLPEGQMDFRMNHRFGEIKGGLNELFGLDYASTSFSLDYTASKNILIGLRRSSFEKTYELYSKYNLIEQTNDKAFSVSLFFDLSYKSQKVNNTSFKYKESYRYDYLYQILLAKEISNIYIQLSPTLVHYNLVKTKQEVNNLFAIGLGIEYNITKRISAVAEYTKRIWKDQRRTYDPISIGINYETYNHSFQLIVTNSIQMSEKGVIGQTFGNITKGELYFGFNMSKKITL